MAHAIDNAFASGFFDEIMVITLDEKIARIARDHDANVSMLFDLKTAFKQHNINQVLLDVMTLYKARGVMFKYACCIYGLSPVIRKSLLEEAYHKLRAGKLDSVIPVVSVHRRPDKAFRLNKGKLERPAPQKPSVPETDYYDWEQFYWFDTRKLFKNKSLLTSNTGSIIIPPACMNAWGLAPTAAATTSFNYSMS